MHPNCFLWLVMAGFAIGPGVGCGHADQPLANGTGKPELRIGYLEIAAQLPLFVAAERGILRDEGIRYRLIPFASSDELVQAGMAGEVDVLAGAALNVVFDANRGAGQPPLLFALNPYSNRAGYVTDHLVVRKSGTVRTVSELRGKRIANFPGSVQGLLHQALEQVGLPRTAYQTVEMSPGEWQPALESGSVDAVAALEPYATQMLFDGVGVSIVSGVLARLMPDVPISGHWLAPGYAAQADMGEVSALVRAYAKAIEFCRQRSAEARQYLVPYANVRPDIVSRVNLNPWRLTSPADTAPIGQYVRLLGSESLTSYQILRYLPK